MEGEINLHSYSDGQTLHPLALHVVKNVDEVLFGENKSSYILLHKRSDIASIVFKFALFVQCYLKSKILTWQFEFNALRV